MIIFILNKKNIHYDEHVSNVHNRRESLEIQTFQTIIYTRKYPSRISKVLENSYHQKHINIYLTSIFRLSNIIQTEYIYTPG